MANFPILAAAPFAWLFRAFLVGFLILAIWSLFFPERYREWNLRLYDRYRWMASPRRQEKMRNSTVGSLRFQSGLILIYAAAMLLVSFKLLP